MNHQQRNSASGAVPLGARFTRSLPAEDGDSASRDKFGNVLRPRALAIHSILLNAK
jgi:hypothetical protein